MEVTAEHLERDADAEEEYILFDLGDVSMLDIPPNAPYVLSGLDTLNPMLTICDKFKMVRVFNILRRWFGRRDFLLLSRNHKHEVGEYEETIGTCLTFAEEDNSVPQEETRSLHGDHLTDAANPIQDPRKKLKPIASVDKILKFRLLPDSVVPNSTSEQTKD